MAEEFDKEYVKKIEEWSAKIAKQEEMYKTYKMAQETRKELQEKRVEQQEKRAEALRANHEAYTERVARNIMRIHTGQKDSAWSTPNMFFFSSGGENKNYKVKKTLKIKMPKSMKIEMDVRHGEVKLAGNTKNLNAKLSYASLLAATIDGDATVINASYSPVTVQKWNYGQLQANYSEQVNLKEVLNLRLSATSSEVVIDQLIKSAFITNDFGPLKINSIAKGFKELDVSMKNAELDCNLPTIPFTIYVKGTSSTFSAPESLVLEKTKNLNSFVHKGHHVNKDAESTITVNSEYSNVTLRQ